MIPGEPRIHLRDVAVGNMVEKLDYHLQTVVGYFTCAHTQIKTLYGSPAKVEGLFSCRFTNISDLKGGPNFVGGDYFCCDNHKLISLKGAAHYVGGNFDFGNTPITSLEGLPRLIGGGLMFPGTAITTLHDIHKIIQKINGVIIIPDSVRSSILGVLKIQGATEIVNDSIAAPKSLDHAVVIINRRFTDKNFHLAQEQLLEAGLKEFARL